MERRSFLKFAGTGAVAGPSLLGPLGCMTTRGPRVWVRSDGAPDWTPVRYPIPLPADAGDASTDRERLATYEVRDEVQVPEGYRVETVAAWGESFGPTDDASRRVRFGHNCDFTGLTPIPGAPGEYWLCVNHEYISARPFFAGYERVTGLPLPDLRLIPDSEVPGGRLVIDGTPLAGRSVDLRAADVPADVRAKLSAIARAALDELGVTVLHVRRRADDVIEVIRTSPRHARFSGMHPTSPTFANCGGCTTPWGTFLTCEENYQDYVEDHVDATGELLPASLRFGGALPDRHTRWPYELRGITQGTTTPYDGRDFGWVCEVDPQARTLTKLRALGRFRHENAAIRAEPGRPLVAYMGDDRRGGHVWKFVSRDVVRDPSDKATSALFADGTLYAARFHASGDGVWVPLEPNTPLVRPVPERQASGHQFLPARPPGVDPVGGLVAVGPEDHPHASLTPDAWVAQIEAFTDRPFAQATLGDLVRPPRNVRLTPEGWRRHQRDVLRLDAFAMANAAGGTTSARPEAIVVHPVDRSIYIAFTDARIGSDGSPCLDAFPDAGEPTSRTYGAIYRIRENDDDPAAGVFQWGRFVSSGEVAEGGGGFACADNLCFDPDGNLWMVCDVTTTTLNATVVREGSTAPGTSQFRGVFGNNALFMIPTTGPLAGLPHCFAIAPMESEFTGPTFTDDGRTLILAIQHPGEQHAARNAPDVDLPSERVRRIAIADRDGNVFTQERRVPVGSNFPSGRPGDPPRASVVCITRG